MRAISIRPALLRRSSTSLTASSNVAVGLYGDAPAACAASIADKRSAGRPAAPAAATSLRRSRRSVFMGCLPSQCSGYALRRASLASPAALLISIIGGQDLQHNRRIARSRTAPNKQTVRSALVATLRADALILVVDPFDAMQQSYDVGAIRARHQQVLCDLIEPNALPVVISFYSAEPLPSALHDALEHCRPAAPMCADGFSMPLHRSNGIISHRRAIFLLAYEATLDERTAQTVGLLSIQEPIEFRGAYPGMRSDQRQRHFQVAALAALLHCFDRSGFASLWSSVHRSCPPRKSRMLSAISLACVSIAKWPVSRKRTTAWGISRLNASAPGRRKNGSFLPHTAKSDGLWVRKYFWNDGYSATLLL